MDDLSCEKLRRFLGCLYLVVRLSEHATAVQCVVDDLSHG